MARRLQVAIPSSENFKLCVFEENRRYAGIGDATALRRTAKLKKRAVLPGGASNNASKKAKIDTNKPCGKDLHSQSSNGPGIYVSETPVGADRSGSLVRLQVNLKAINGSTFETTNEGSLRVNDRRFWQVLEDRIKQKWNGGERVEEDREVILKV